MNDKIIKADELMQQGKNSKAVAIIKKAIKEEPDNPYGHYLLGIARMKCGLFFLAKKALEKANQLLPDNAENLRSLGWVKVMLGQIDEAREDLRKSISLDMVNPLGYVDLAMSYFDYFDFTEGMQWLKRAQALAPKDPFILQSIKTAKEMKKAISRYSAKQLKQMKKEKLDPKNQQAFRIAVLERHYGGRRLSKAEAEEMKEEARLNGAAVSVLTPKQEKELIRAKDKSKALKIKEILKQRKVIETKLTKLIKQTKGDFTLKDIKEMIYNEEEDRDDLMKIVALFDNHKSRAEFKKMLRLINDAWNYFPHKCLGGLCPIEKILQSQGQN